MKKKIDLFWYWFILVVAFVLCFFAVNDKKIGAYFLNSDGNLVSDNLVYNDREFLECGHGYNAICTENNGVSINVVPGDASNVGYRYITKNLKEFFTDYGDYRITLFSSTNKNAMRVCLFGDTDSIVLSCSDFDTTNGIMTTTFNYESSTKDYNKFIVIYVRTPYFTFDNVFIDNFMITKGNTIYENYIPGGVWYSESNAEDMFLGRLPNFTSSLTYTNQDNGVTSTINDVNSYIDNSFGYLYFDRLWNYLDSLTSSSYDNAKLTIIFNDNLNINTSYIINSNKENYGSGVWFYQNNDLMLDVRNFLDNEYCAGSSQYSCNVELNKHVNVGSGVNSFSYLNKIVVWSSTTTERTLAFGYNNIGYNTGYDNGYNVGYKDGKKVADDLIYNNGYTDGYNIGYDSGVNYASGGGNTLVGLVGSIFTAPVNMLHTIFDFEFLGINLTNFLFSLISLFIVIWLIKKFL